MTCDIVIPVWNQLEHTKACVDSIIAHTGRECGMLIFVDNASDRATAKYLETLTQGLPIPVTLIRNKENLGFVKAANQGIRASSAPCVCILNNDTIATSGWLERMLEVAASDRMVGLVNPSSNNLGQRPPKGEPIDAYAAELALDPSLSSELGACIGFCMLITREVIEKVGVFDEVYGMGNFEDTDLSRRAVKAGYRCVRACRAYVYHHENTSFKKRITFSEEFEHNRQIFEFRWGKPRRIAYILDRWDRPLRMRLSAEALDAARQGSRVWFFSQENLELPRHSNIMATVLPAKHFHLNAAFRILKKKKKYSELYVTDERFGRILEALTFIHRARVNYY